MTDLFLINSLTRKKEKFIPIDPPNIGMYTCGPTVYDYQHIGNLRTMVLSDILRRTLQVNDYKVKSVRNITDIDDKIIKGAKKKNIAIDKFSKEYTRVFFEDLKKLNVISDNVTPKATEHIVKMIDYIKELQNKKLAYLEKDGSVYFDISKFKNYGKLSGIKKRKLKTNTRTLSDEYTKNNVQDFALWKSVEEDEVGYDSPWGRGRPGWHIECSVMSQEYLGDTFDIHVGGIDLLFPHHENEIAQSEGKTGKKFVNYFIHGEFLMVDGKKMSKSLGNLYTIEDVEKKGFDPLSLRYLYLTAHYRDSLNFTWKSLKAAQNALDRLHSLVAGFRAGSRKTLSSEKLEKVDVFRKDFIKALNDDLNTARALAVLWEMLKSNVPSEDKYDLAISFDEVLGLGLAKVSKSKTQIPKKVKELMKKREELRKEGKFKESDKVRKEILKLGYQIEDTSQGPKVRGIE